VCGMVTREIRVQVKMIVPNETPHALRQIFALDLLHDRVAFHLPATSGRKRGNANTTNASVPVAASGKSQPSFLIHELQTTKDRKVKLKAEILDNLVAVRNDAIKHLNDNRLPNSSDEMTVCLMWHQGSTWDKPDKRCSGMDSLTVKEKKISEHA
jgi:hypothetical protein